MHLIAAVDLTSLMSTLSVILKVAIGLGAVIFVHELGHFLVAKMCGVKIEKFMIGFDIGGYKIAWRRGETLYGIGILPLGGYVKMLGQDDDPAHIAEQMQKSQLDPNSTEAVPIKGPNGETYYVDRRSYLAKSVPQRMAIISAGVVMNIIFAFIFAVIAYGMGVPYLPSVVSETMPGAPAWQAALEPGDEIVQIGNRKDPTFMQLMGGVTLGDLESGVDCVVRRAATGKLEALTLKPKREEGEVAMIGISGPRTLELSDRQATFKNSPAAAARLVSSDEAKAESDKPQLKSGDKIVKVNNTPVAGYRELAALLARQPDKPVQITIERTAANKKATKAESGKKGEAVQLTFDVAAEPLRDFGLAMKMGPITAVQANSPAAAVGIKVDDVIQTVDGKPNGEGWTPDTLPDVMRTAAEEGRTVELGLVRGGTDGAAGEEVKVSIKPRVPTMFYSALALGAPQGVEALGITYRVTNEVQAVAAGGPAADSNIKPGDVLLSAKIIRPEEDGKLPKPVDVKLGIEEFNWSALVEAVQFAPPGTYVEFKVTGKGDKEARDVKITPTAVAGGFYPPRGFAFNPEKRTRTAATFADQLRLGLDETVDALTMVVRFLQKLGSQVPLTMLGGPGTIAAAAGGAASQGLASLLIFLTMLSANLAVLNFLPIPLLDGGHFVFLAYEGIRGRPANEKFVIALHTAGFVFIVGLMLFVIGLDIQRWVFPAS
jgi:regulator of sigma E protease